VRTIVASFVVGMTVVGALPAAAQTDPAAYQAALLARPLSAADQAICAAKGGSQDQQDACHVTRLLLADLAAGQVKSFPPLADIKYTVNQGELSRVFDTMTKFSD
jgi:hypothetical protein